MVEGNSESDVVFPPALLGQRWTAAAWRAVAVFVIGYVLPVLVLLASNFGYGVRWVAILLTYMLVSLAIFRFLESRSAARMAVLDMSPANTEMPRAAAALDQVVDTGREAVHSASKPGDWSLELLNQLDWKRMTDLCLAYFSDRFQCKAGALAEDGSVEILLFKDSTERPAGLVHCRAWGEREITLETLENLSLKMAQGLIARGFCMGYGSFTPEAKEFAKAHAISLIDDAMFLSMLKRLPDERNSQLLALVVEGDYTVPTCPECGLKMIVRQHEQARYWGCRAYPRCKAVLAMRQRYVPASASALAR